MKVILKLSVVTILLMLHSQTLWAQLGILEVIKAGIRKAIQAIDLQVQRIQTETLTLQHIEQALQNQMSDQKLGAIANAQAGQQRLFQGYYPSLRDVRQSIYLMNRVKDILRSGKGLMEQYRSAVAQAASPWLSPGEQTYQLNIFQGIARSVTEDLARLRTLHTKGVTELTEGERLAALDQLLEQIRHRHSDLYQARQQLDYLIRQRSATLRELHQSNRIYPSRP